MILIVAEGSTPLAALALARHAKQGERQIVSPLSAPHAECVDVVGPGASRPDVAAAIADYLTQCANAGLAIALTDVPAESPLARELVVRFGWHTRHVPNALVHLPLDWPAMDPSMRRQHAKRERRLRTGAHDIVYRRTRTTGELLAAYEVLDQLHSARWDSSPSPTGTDIRWPDILRHFTSDLAFIASITIDGTPAASQLCLFRSQVCFSLRPAMNPHLSRLAPGHLLLRRLADDLSTAGFTELDLGRTKETPGQLGYKQQYFPEWKESVSFCTHPLLSGGE
ncbi:GNAT family N-acetyltransferase [Streptomyces noursei]|uniref:GNAT family N-acetyltransferase n=1 Tax=Streptomyces noursei TaxID=1971 RepID=UPI0035DF2347